MMQLPQVRSRRGESPIDSLPESFPYRDDGCYLHQHCLTCPLPQCIYDNPGWLQRQRRRGRDQQVLAAREREQLSVPQVAAKFGISERTVFRIISRNAAFPSPEEAMGVAVGAA